MAINLSAGHPGIVAPEDVGALVVQPVDRLSVAAQVSTVVNTAGPEFRIPIVTDDVSAGWFAEGAEITEQSPGTDELIVTPRKLAVLTVSGDEDLLRLHGVAKVRITTARDFLDAELPEP